MIAVEFVLSLLTVNAIELTWHRVQHATWATVLTDQVKAVLKWGAILALHISFCMLGLFLVDMWAESVSVCVFFLSGFLPRTILYIHFLPRIHSCLITSSSLALTPLPHVSPPPISTSPLSASNLSCVSTRGGGGPEAPALPQSSCLPEHIVRSSVPTLPTHYPA